MLDQAARHPTIGDCAAVELARGCVVKTLNLVSLFVGGAAVLIRKNTDPNATWGEALVAGAAWGGATYGIGAIGTAVYDEYQSSTNPRTLVSHHHGPDGWYKDLLADEGSADDGAFRFRDKSPTKRIRTQDPSRIRADLTRRVRESDQLVVVVGKQTHKRPYVRHEIAVAVEEQKPVVAVKLDRRYKSPPELLGVGAIWSKSPALEDVGDAMERRR